MRKPAGRTFTTRPADGHGAPQPTRPSRSRGEGVHLPPEGRVVGAAGRGCSRSRGVGAGDHQPMMRFAAPFGVCHAGEAKEAGGVRDVGLRIGA